MFCKKISYLLSCLVVASSLEAMISQNNDLPNMDKKFAQDISCHNKCKKNRHHRECDRIHVISSVPYTIDRPGKYCVKRDLTYNGSDTAITITASNVTLNFANHSLFLTDPNATGVAAADVEEITIENDKIISITQSTSPTSSAIHFLRVSKAKLSNIFTENTFFGVNIEESNDVVDFGGHHKNHVGARTASGIEVLSSSNVTVDNTVVEGNSGNAQFFTAGIRIQGTSRNVSVLNSEFLDCDSSIHPDQVDGMLIENVLISSAPTALFNGIQLGTLAPAKADANDVIIRNTTIANHNASAGYDGLILLSGHGCLVENVVVDINAAPVQGFFPGALHVGCGTNSGCSTLVFYSDAIIRNVVLTDEASIGVLIEAGSNIVIEDSEIVGSAVANARFDIALGCTIKNSLISNSDGDGIVINAGSNDNSILNNTVNDNNNGIIVNSNAVRNHLQGNNVFSNANFGIRNLDLSTETYFNTSCNNGGVNCTNVSPDQSPGDSPAVAGSNLCCPQE